MLVTYIRSSSFNNYSFCQMQYFLTYTLGHQSTSGKKAQLGTIVHKVMEVLAGCQQLIQDKKKMLLIDYMVFKSFYMLIIKIFLTVNTNPTHIRSFN